ncbi:hypothetical protein ABZP36_006032 [Zizania latifolia]
MRGPSALASLAGAAAALLLLDGCAGAMYKVGDLDAWGVPPPSKPDVYSRWAKSIHFALGDSIWFLYPPSQDSVVQVTPRAFAACEVSDPVLKLDDGNSVFNLTTPGRFYYTSAAQGHCQKGQKMAIDVPMANGTYLPPSANDLAAFAPVSAEGPAGFESALGPAGAHPSAAFRAAAGAGSVVAALSFAIFL